MCCSGVFTSRLPKDSGESGMFSAENARRSLPSEDYVEDHVCSIQPTIARPISTSTAGPCGTANQLIYALLHVLR